jgi:hypothetical protein
MYIPSCAAAPRGNAFQPVTSAGLRRPPPHERSPRVVALASADAVSYAAVRVIAPEVLELADATIRRRAPSHMAWSWGEGLLLYALLRLDARLGESRYRWFVETYFADHVARAHAPVTWSDECPPGLAALELYRLTGRAEYLALAEPVARYLRAAPRTQDGGLNHFGVSRWSRLYPQSMWRARWFTRAVHRARVGARSSPAAERSLSHRARARELCRDVRDGARYLRALRRTSRGVPGAGSRSACAASVSRAARRPRAAYRRLVDGRHLDGDDAVSELGLCAHPARPRRSARRCRADSRRYCRGGALARRYVGCSQMVIAYVG